MAESVVRLPIFCGFRELVIGNGWAAGVEAYGRVLLEQEADGCWAYAVEAGVISAGGQTQAEAISRLSEALRAWLFDDAKEAASFQDFQSRVIAFFDDTDEASERLWLAAVQDVRAGRVQPGSLQRERAELEPWVRVTELRKQVSENRVPAAPKVAA